MFHLIDPDVAKDHGTASAMLCDITRFVKLAVSHPEMGEGVSDREGARHLLDALSSCIADLDALAEAERDAAYQRGLAEGRAGVLPVPELTEPASQSGRRQRTA